MDIPHVTFIAPMETKVTWDGTSPCSFLEVLGNTMSHHSTLAISQTILSRTFSAATD